MTLGNRALPGHNARPTRAAQAFCQGLPKQAPLRRSCVGKPGEESCLGVPESRRGQHGKLGGMWFARMPPRHMLIERAPGHMRTPTVQAGLIT